MRILYNGIVPENEPLDEEQKKPDDSDFSVPMTFKEKIVNCFNQFNCFKLDPAKVESVEIDSHKIIIKRHLGSVLVTDTISINNILFYFGKPERERQQDERNRIANRAAKN